MRPAYIRPRVLLVAAVLVQVWLLLYPHFGPQPYRHEQRMKAFVHWKEIGTSEAKAAFEAEERMLDTHLKVRSFLLIGGFFLLNGVLCYFFWNYAKRTWANQPLQATAR